VGGALGEALAYAGPVPQTIRFTDWAAIRAAAGADQLTGESPFEDKVRALRNAATPGGFGIQELKTHHDDWGFDVMDLAWEVHVSWSGGSNFFVLRLREGFDLGVLSAKLDGYGFATEPLPHGVLRSAGIGVFTQPDRFLRNFSFASTGFVEDGRTLVLSLGTLGDPAWEDPVPRMLTDGPQAVADLSVQSVARLLGSPDAAFIAAASNWCERIIHAYPSTPAVQAKVDELVAAAGPLAAYNALAIGYRLGHDPLGRIVFGYPEEGQAAADLEGRRSLAENGISSDSRDAGLIRYADRVFTVLDARVEERAIVLDLARPQSPTPAPNPSSIITPTDLFALQLMRMAAEGTMLFAIC
jgi:hypothetical protein